MLKFCQFHFSILTLIFIFYHPKVIQAHDLPAENKNTPQTIFSNPLNHFKNKSVSFFPIPIFETSPNKGESYGLMPVALFSDKKTDSIHLILAALGFYNNITKFSGGGIVHLYPRPVSHPEETLELYGEIAQRYYRETKLKYFNPNLTDKIYFSSEFSWLKTPFPRFYGYGAGSMRSGESNYVGRHFFFETTFGWYVKRTLRVNLTETFTTTDLLTRAFTDVDDTLTRYAGLNGVYDATHLIHKTSLTYDTRPNRLFSKRGRLAEGSYFFALKDILADSTLNGFSLEAIQLVPFFKDWTTTALRLFIQDIYGTNMPFYLQSTLGSDKELRSFIPNRFTDTGKIILTAEQRFRVLSVKLFGFPVDFYADPFVEAGRVFHHINNFTLNNVQFVGGLGFRAFVPPNVIGRVDLAVGSEGFGVYTMLGYPF